MDNIKKLMTKIYDIISQPAMKVLPGQLAFFFVLSIIPIIVLVVFIASLFSVSIDAFVTFVETALPADVSEVLLPFMQASSFDSNLLILMLIGFFVASNGSHSIIISSDTLFEIPYEHYIKRRIKAIVLTIIIVLLFIFILIVLAFGNLIVKFTMDLGVLGDLASTIYLMFVLLKWPLSFILIFIIIKLVYTLALDRQIKSKFMNKGAIFTTLGWILITAMYSYYVTNFANYDLFYGSLSSLVVMMIWIYILAIIFVIGIAINANNYNLVKNTSSNSEEKSKY